MESDKCGRPGAVGRDIAVRGGGGGGVESRKLEKEVWEPDSHLAPRSPRPQKERNGERLRDLNGKVGTVGGRRRRPDR
ncbi:hypothetical protein E2C01_039918 [Portunus trituberculatus]|uniref:Uncharacterized protein n=1 Tax=Portunus trituberculatus TaxID=210409 RepID=A0A5B7FLA7_PORTR|nr:hypothetical protein [Portunus trituberculatus]